MVSLRVPEPEPVEGRCPPGVSTRSGPLARALAVALDAPLHTTRGHVRCPVMTVPSEPPRKLPRKLGLATGIAVVVGVIIGSGIFRVPSPIAAEAGNLTGITLVWVLGGIIALFGALSIAELAAMYPEAGGPYVY